MSIEPSQLKTVIYSNSELPEEVIKEVNKNDVFSFKNIKMETEDLLSKPDAILKFSNDNSADAVIIVKEIESLKIYNLYTDSSNTNKFIMINKIKTALEAYSNKKHEEKLSNLKLKKDNLYPVKVVTHDRATLISFAKSSFSGQAGVVLVILLIVGMYYPAINAFIGEKDKKTMDVLILASNNESNILIAKLLNIITFGLLTFIPYLFDYLLIKIVLDKEIVEQYSIFSLDNIFIFFINFMSLSFVIGAICILISIISKTTTRAQSMLSGLFLILMIPIIFLTVIDKKMSMLMAMVPVMNFFYLLRDIILGQVNVAGSLLSAFTNLILFIILLKFCMEFFQKRYVLKV